MIEQGLTWRFKIDMLNGFASLSTQPAYMALYTAFATLNMGTQTYTTENEVVGTGYTAGGKLLDNPVISVDTNTGTAYVTFDNVSWPGADFTARGALLYFFTPSQSSIAVLDFGSDKIFSAVSNTVTMPANTATTALIRLP